MSAPKEIVSDRTVAARAVERPLEVNSKFKPGGCEELGKASVRVRLLACARMILPLCVATVRSSFARPRAGCAQCIEQNGYNRQAPECQKHFDAYKECRKNESKNNSDKRKLKSLFF